MNRSLLYPRATTTRRLIGLDGMWRFSFDPESKGVEAGWALDLPSSLSMPVPASFCDLFTDKASREYCGDFWYETSFFVPAEWSGWDIVLRFGSVTHRARVFVNGVEVAQHEGGFLPFDATVDAARSWKPEAFGLADYLNDDVTDQPGQSMGAYWVQTRG